MTKQNKMIVRRLIDEVWNQGNFAVADELVASDYIGHSSTETRGTEGYKQFFDTQRKSFPDIQYTLEDVLAEGDRVVTRWSARATHRGEFQGISPTGKQGAVTGVSIFRIANGKVVECWTERDALGLMQQLGVIPAPDRRGAN